jgi:preprotein translocase subunit SecF
MPLKIVSDNTNIGFVKLRFIAFAFTIALTIGAGALLGLRGLNLGVDFLGGLTMQVEFTSPPELDTLRARVNQVGVGDAALQEFGKPSTILVRLPLPEGDAGAVQRVVAKVRTALEKDYPGVSFARVESVSGKVSDELITDGLWAVGLSMLFVAVFTWFRFEWYFGVSTVVALVRTIQSYDPAARESNWV